MELNFNIEKIFRGNLVYISQDFLKGLSKSDFNLVSNAIDKFGELSSKAQGLKTTITTTSKYLLSPDQKLYIKCKDNTIIGYVKTGIKKLFISDRNGKINEILPLCFLDFYVHESQQRYGFGKLLFDYMLKMENNINPSLLAYDRPSIKLLSFLKKYFNLVDYVPQNNNFVVYDDYFIAIQSKNYSNNSKISNKINKGNNFDEMDTFINNFSGLSIGTNKNLKEKNDYDKLYNKNDVNNSNKSFQKFNVNNTNNLTNTGGYGNISQVGNMIINSNNSNKLISNNNIFSNYSDKSVKSISTNNSILNQSNNKSLFKQQLDNNNNFNKFKSTNSTYGSYYN